MFHIEEGVVLNSGQGAKEGLLAPAFGALSVRNESSGPSGRAGLGRERMSSLVSCGLLLGRRAGTKLGGQTFHFGTPQGGVRSKETVKIGGLD